MRFVVAQGASRSGNRREQEMSSGQCQGWDWLYALVLLYSIYCRWYSSLQAELWLRGRELVACEGDTAGLCSPSVPYACEWGWKTGTKA